MAHPAPTQFDNSYSRLPDRFHVRQLPQAAPAPELIAVNRPLADQLGLALPDDPAGQAALFSGNALPDGAAPLAMAYAGHQFGHFNPQLGDGRALLIGEVMDRTGTRRDIQLKGSGPTPFSRQGDGLAALGPVLREYILSEAMHALGVPTTRALAAVSTGAPVHRDVMQPGAVFTRVAASHLRVGTFQFFAARQDHAALADLTGYAIARHYPDAADAARPALALLAAVTTRQAELVAHWMQIGFIHGVMNTDNCAISGETIDYGPCAFLDEYDPAKVFSSIDAQGRYAYRNQPGIAQWNMARLAEALLPQIDPDADSAIAAATPVIEGFSTAYDAAWQRRFRAKFGLIEAAEADVALIAEFLTMIATAQADFTLSFDALTRCAATGDAGQLADLGGFADWHKAWRDRIKRDAARAAETMQTANPVIIPRNHWVEAAIQAAASDGDFTLFHDLLAATARPFDPAQRSSRFAQAPAVEERVLQTFCGT